MKKILAGFIAGIVIATTLSVFAQGKAKETKGNILNPEKEAALVKKNSARHASVWKDPNPKVADLRDAVKDYLGIE